MVNQERPTHGKTSNAEESAEETAMGRPCGDPMRYPEETVRHCDTPASETAKRKKNLIRIIRITKGPKARGNCTLWAIEEEKVRMDDTRLQLLSPSTKYKVSVNTLDD
ncbi:hypothetical protein NDU88_002419 [Pleurodeles waltl]|uniref:Uncharacterized protein n=1 Tax=Pleurodeles waltl TaxID=8319 RepID=A0AAV7VDN7_PLEWA|nr:hypothetical protein NDU88_002419 [Pleurodeles waltl]